MTTQPSKIRRLLEVGDFFHITPATHFIWMVRDLNDRVYQAGRRKFTEYWDEFGNHVTFDGLPEYPNRDASGRQRSKSGAEQEFVVVETLMVPDGRPDGGFGRQVLAQSTRDPRWMFRFCQSGSFLAPKMILIEDLEITG